MSRRTAAPALSPKAAMAAEVVHAWRVAQLVRLGLASLVADAVADHVDWHEVARLVRLGCPATLAVVILE